MLEGSQSSKHWQLPVEDDLIDDENDNIDEVHHSNSFRGSKTQLQKPLFIGRSSSDSSVDYGEDVEEGNDIYTLAATTFLFVVLTIMGISFSIVYYSTNHAGAFPWLLIALLSCMPAGYGIYASLEAYKQHQGPLICCRKESHTSRLSMV